MTEENKHTGLGKWTKRTLYSLAGAVAIAGTYSAHEGDCPPIYVHKTGTSGGLCVGLIVNVEKNAKFYGGIVSLGGNNCGEVNGLEFNLIGTVGAGGKLNGLELGLVNTQYDTNSLPESVNGLQIGLINSTKSGYGAQVGIINEMEDGNGAQVGIINLIKHTATNSSLSIGLNYSFKGKNKDKTKAEESEK